MEFLGVAAVVITSVLSLIYAYFKHSFRYWKSRGVPFDSPSFPFGNAKNIGKTIHPPVFLKRLYDKFKPTGAKVCGAYLFCRPVILLLDLDVVKNILVKDFHNFNEREIYYNDKDNPIEGNLFTLDGEKWKNFIIKFTPTFTSGKMKFMFQSVIEIGSYINVVIYTKNLHI